MRTAALPDDAVKVSDDVAYTLDGLCDFEGDEGHQHDVRCIGVWHWCEHKNWAGREGYDADPGAYVGWTLAGVGAHTLVSSQPLHLEASVYWPDCCGKHGWIRDGRWTDA